MNNLILNHINNSNVQHFSEKKMLLKPLVESDQDSSFKLYMEQKEKKSDKDPKLSSIDNSKTPDRQKSETIFNHEEQEEAKPNVEINQVPELEYIPILMTNLKQETINENSQQDSMTENLSMDLNTESLPANVITFQTNNAQLDENITSQMIVIPDIKNNVLNMQNNPSDQAVTSEINHATQMDQISQISLNQASPTIINSNDLKIHREIDKFANNPIIADAVDQEFAENINHLNPDDNGLTKLPDSEINKILSEFSNSSENEMDQSAEKQFFISKDNFQTTNNEKTFGNIINEITEKPNSAAKSEINGYQQLANIPKSIFDNLNTNFRAHFKIDHIIDSGDKHLTIKLSPADLGQVNFKLEMPSEGLAKLSVTAESREALSILKENIQELRQVLNDIGIQTGDSPEFNLNDSNHRSSQNEKQNYYHQIQNKLGNITENKLDINNYNYLKGDIYQILGEYGSIDLRV